MLMVRHQLFVAPRFLALLAATAPVALMATYAAAQSVWTGTADNAFENDANWTPGAPAASDSATVNTGSPQVSTGETIDRLNVGGGNVTVTNTGALSVTSGTTMTSGSVTINSGGLLTSDVDLVGGSLAVDGTLDGKLSLQNGSVTVNGTLRDAVVGNGTSLSNNGTMTGASVASGGTFTNNGGATLSTLNNAGTASNAGRVGTLQNTGGNFTNNAGGEVLGKTTVSGGSVTNNFVVTDVDVAAAAAFTNNVGATAGNVRNSGTVVNAGTVASLQNDGGSFTNNVDGRINGQTTIAGGTVTNNFVVTDVDVAAAAAFANNAGATAGNVRNSGSVTNAGRSPRSETTPERPPTMPAAGSPARPRLREARLPTISSSRMSMLRPPPPSSTIPEPPPGLLPTGARPPTPGRSPHSTIRPGSSPTIRVER